ncbi:MAG: hypothetical protein O2794_01030 [bacterium]|nr:hypothetical protein [bacterium]
MTTEILEEALCRVTCQKGTTRTFWIGFPLDMFPKPSAIEMGRRLLPAEDLGCISCILHESCGEPIDVKLTLMG